jgi:hypothetical protein
MRSCSATRSVSDSRSRDAASRRFCSPSSAALIGCSNTVSAMRLGPSRARATFGAAAHTGARCDAPICASQIRSRGGPARRWLAPNGSADRRIGVAESGARRRPDLPDPRRDARRLAGALLLRLRARSVLCCDTHARARFAQVLLRSLSHFVRRFAPEYQRMAKPYLVAPPCARRCTTICIYTRR